MNLDLYLDATRKQLVYGPTSPTRIAPPASANPTASTSGSSPERQFGAMPPHNVINSTKPGGRLRWKPWRRVASCQRRSHHVRFHLQLLHRHHRSQHQRPQHGCRIIEHIRNLSRDQGARRKRLCDLGQRRADHPQLRLQPGRRHRPGSVRQLLHIRADHFGVRSQNGRSRRHHPPPVTRWHQGCHPGLPGRRHIPSRL